MDREAWMTSPMVVEDRWKIRSANDDVHLQMKRLKQIRRVRPDRDDCLRNEHCR